MQRGAAVPGDSVWQRLFPTLLKRRITGRQARSGELVLVAVLDPARGPGLDSGMKLQSQRMGARKFELERAAPNDAHQLDSLLTELAPRVLVLDVELCALLGMATLRHLRRTHTGIDWLLGWTEPSPRWVEAAIHSQANGAVQWDIEPAEFTRALDAVSAGELWFSRRVLQWLYASMLSAARSDGPMSLPSESTPSGYELTAREAEVLALMRQGFTNQQIGDRLGISINTVKKHLASAFEKRGLRSRRQTLA